MDLLDIVQEIVQKNMNAAQLTDLRIGTVTKVNPLEITTDISAQPLQTQILYLTDAVVEKKLSALEHTHQYSGGQTQPALSAATFTVNGQAVPSAGGDIVLSPALAVGDKVILLRVQNGQKYIALSRVYGGGS